MADDAMLEILKSIQATQAVNVMPPIAAFALALRWASRMNKRLAAMAVLSLLPSLPDGNPQTVSGQLGEGHRHSSLNPINPIKPIKIER